MVRDECGVFQSRDLGRIEFVHLSFQEYLAACHVSHRGLGAELADRAGDPRWEEVILLAMSRPGVFAPFMRRALERDDLELDFLRQCMRETLELAPEPFEDAAKHARARLDTAGSEATHALRRVFSLVQGHELPGVVAVAQQVIEHSDPELRAVARRLVGLEDASVATAHAGGRVVEPATGMRSTRFPPPPRAQDPPRHRQRAGGPTSTRPGRAIFCGPPRRRRRMRSLPAALPI